MKANDFIDRLKTYQGCPYLYGCFGQVVSDSLINQKALQYPNIYTKDYIKYAKSLIGKVAMDCSGLIKRVLMDCYNNGGYVSEFDKNSTFMINKWCNDKQKIDNLTIMRAGDLLYMEGKAPSYISHIGVYIGDHKVIQSAWNVGVIINNFKDTKWEYKGTLNIVTHSMEVKEHWAQKHYDNLVSKGVINDDYSSAIWRDFDKKLDTITVGQILAILSRSY